MKMRHAQDETRSILTIVQSVHGPGCMMFRQYDKPIVLRVKYFMCVLLFIYYNWLELNSPNCIEFNKIHSNLDWQLQLPFNYTVTVIVVIPALNLQAQHQPRLLSYSVI